MITLSSETIIQLVGFLACAIQISGYYIYKNPRHVLINQSVACLAWCAHFLMLGSLSIAFLSFAICLRCLITSKIEQKYLSSFLATYLIIVLPIMFMTAVGTADYVSMICAVIGVIMCVFRDQKRLFFLGGLSGCMTWLVVHSMSGSIAGFVNELLVLKGLGFALYRAFKTEKGPFYCESRIPKKASPTEEIIAADMQHALEELPFDIETAKTRTQAPSAAE